MTQLFTKIDDNKMCSNNTNFSPVTNRNRNFLLVAITSEVTNQKHQSRLGIVRFSFRDRVNGIYNLNLALTLIITSTDSKTKSSLT